MDSINWNSSQLSKDVLWIRLVKPHCSTIRSNRCQLVNRSVIERVSTSHLGRHHDDNKSKSPPINTYNSNLSMKIDLHVLNVTIAHKLQHPSSDRHWNNRFVTVHWAIVTLLNDQHVDHEVVYDWFSLFLWLYNLRAVQTPKTPKQGVLISPQFQEQYYVLPVPSAKFKRLIED